MNVGQRNGGLYFRHPRRVDGQQHLEGLIVPPSGQRHRGRLTRPLDTMRSFQSAAAVCSSFRALAK